MKKINYLETQKTEPVIIKEAQKIQNPVITTNQIIALLAKTPTKYTYKRPAKGGGQWTYISGGYVKKTLNRIFGWNWSFEITDKFKEDGEVIVQGKLTIRNNEGNTLIVKEDFGKKEIMCKKGSSAPLSIGNDYKSASTDSLKRCAFQLGLASDIYAPQEYRELENPIKTITNDKVKIKEAGDKIKKTKSVEELKTVWADLPAEIKKEMEDIKNLQKEIIKK